MKSKSIISLLFLGLVLSACGTTSESSEPSVTSEDVTSQEPTTSEQPVTSEEPVTSEQQVTSEDVTSEEVTSEEVTSEQPVTSEDPIISPSIEFTIAEPYDGTFWDGLNLTLEGEALRTHLNLFMWDRFTKIDYNTVSDAVWEMDQDPSNTNNVLSLYDLHSVPKSQQNYVWNREHVFPQSKLADGNSSLRAAPTTKNISSDAANIFAADNDLNTTRSNYSFIDLDLEEKYEPYTIYNSFGTRTDNFIYRGYFAPTQKIRGELARAQLYMIVMYPDNASVSENFSLADMLRWNIEFAPTVERDMQRNAGLEKWQDLRNPFIDMPELGCQVFGDFNASTKNVCGL